MEALKVEFFVGYKAAEASQQKIEVEELLAMQDATFMMTSSATGGGTLEIKMPKKSK